MKKIYCITIILNFIILSSTHSQNQNEDYPIFKLATTPFISKANLALGFSYGFNYGNPSLNIHQWILPNDSKNILFDYSEIRISFLNSFSLFLGYSKMFLTAYNSPPNVNNYANSVYKFGIKWKFIKANGYTPAFSVELNRDYAVSLSLGSSENRLKYYLTADCTLMYIVPIPILLSSGLSFEIIRNFNLVFEGSFNKTHGGTVSTQSLRTGLNYSPLKYLNFNIGLFYFGFDYEETIPGGISGLSPIDKYYLFSGGVTLDFSLLDN